MAQNCGRIHFVGRCTGSLSPSAALKVASPCRPVCVLGRSVIADVIHIGLLAKRRRILSLKDFEVRKKCVKGDSTERGTKRLQEVTDEALNWRSTERSYTIRHTIKYLLWLVLGYFCFYYVRSQAIIIIFDVSRLCISYVLWSQRCIIYTEENLCNIVIIYVTFSKVYTRSSYIALSRRTHWTGWH